MEIDVDAGDCDELIGDEVSLESGGIRGVAVSALFSMASYLTDPICKAHQLWRRISTVESLHADRIERLIRECLLGIGMVACAIVATATTLPGIVLRKLAILLQNQNFRCIQTKALEKALGDTFTLYGHNIAAVGAGYAISDAGVTPWPFRMPAIIENTLKQNADVVIFNEVFDTQAALQLKQALEKDYAHIYHSFGKRAIGPCAGIFIASKFPIKDIKFTPFPKEYLVGRTKNCSKGFVQLVLDNDVQIISTHLQHSEECGYPTDEERKARRNQMAMIEAAIKASKCCYTILIGDLNMDENEWKKYAENFKRDPAVIGKPTWGGDKWYATMVGGKRISGPFVYDYTAIWGNKGNITTTLVQTGFDGTVFKAGALSDHLGQLSTITVRN